MAGPTWESDFAEYFAVRSAPLRRLAYGLCGDWHLAEGITQLAMNHIYLHRRTHGALSQRILSEWTSDRYAAWLLGDRGGECDHVGVLTDATVERVRELRAAGLTPKLIARKLSVPLRDVSRLVTSLAAERGRSIELVGCWVNAGWSAGLSVPADRDWPDVPHDKPHPSGGIVTALVARKHRHDSVSVCVYLVDVYCLGVKNAVPPRVMPTRDLATFRANAFRGYESGECVAAPLDLVQHLVFGAVDYARTLGFEPHADLAPATGHLGDWAGPSAIGFGLDGKPFYVEGPYDDPNKVLRTLERTVGRDGYHFTVDAAALSAGALGAMDLKVLGPDVRQLLLTNASVMASGSTVERSAALGPGTRHDSVCGHSSVPGRRSR